MGLPILGIIEQVTGVAGEVIDRVWPSDKDKAEVENIKAEITSKLQAAALKEDGMFQQFILDFEGRAKDMPKSIQILRASVRPLITYLITGTIAWLVWNGKTIPTELHQLALLCLAFWFGDKTVRNYISAKQGKDIH